MKSNIATITSKGQVTIPSYIREKFYLDSGAWLEFIIKDGLLVVFPLNKSAKSLKGFLKKPKKVLSIDEMNNAIRDVHDRG